MSYRITGYGRAPDLPDQRDPLCAAPVIVSGLMVNHSQFPGWAMGQGRFFQPPDVYVTDKNLATDFWTICMVQ